MFRKEALAVVGLSWCLASVLGAAPFLLSGTCKGHDETPDVTEATAGVRMSAVDSLFESVSGFSGTGATVITVTFPAGTSGTSRLATRDNPL